MRKSLLMYVGLLAASFLLVSCGGSSARLPQVAPLACPVEATSPRASEPLLPDSAGMVQPSTAAEKAATGAFLTWLATYTDWAREGEARGDAVKAWCDNRASQ